MNFNKESKCIPHVNIKTNTTGREKNKMKHFAKVMIRMEWLLKNLWIYFTL
ncbi:hypothetical protein BH10BAC3_BH10BAC3_42810 [soil metagenome]